MNKKELYTGFIKCENEEIEILFYMDKNDLKEYSTDELIPIELISDVSQTHEEEIKAYKGFQKKELKKILKKARKSKLEKSRLKIIKKFHTIYKVPIRIIDKDESIQDFKRSIPDFEKRYTMIPGKECGVKKNLALFKYTNIVSYILVYQTLHETYEELLTGISITCLEKDETDPNFVHIHMGQSESAHIRFEELEEATEKEINEYSKHPKKKIKEQLSKIIVKAGQAYYEVMKTIEQPKQKKRKIQQGGGFINR